MRSIEEFVPHSGPMCLLDELVSFEGETLCASVTVRADSLFFDSQGPQTQMGAWVGIEFMAQGVAAWAGYQSRRQGQAPKMGFLLGTRRFESCVSSFQVGQELQVFIKREFQADNGLGQFECRIESDGQTLASATLTVFGPSDPEAFLLSQSV